MTQHQLSNLNLLSHDELNTLLCRVADEKDARATVYVYDYMKNKCLSYSDESKSALVKLEKARNYVELYDVYVEQYALAPARRIHKICKGARSHVRSEEAKLIIDQAIKWLRTCPDGFSKMHRIDQAKIISTDLGISFDLARGVVTKLKQKGCL